MADEFAVLDESLKRFASRSEPPSWIEAALDLDLARTREKTPVFELSIVPENVEFEAGFEIIELTWKRQGTLLDLKQDFLRLMADVLANESYIRRTVESSAVVYGVVTRDSEPPGYAHRFIVRITGSSINDICRSYHDTP